MKCKYLILTLFVSLMLLNPIVAHRDDDEDEAGCQMEEDNYLFNLSPLQASEGSAWAVKNRDGDVIYFNFCDSLESDATSLGCAEDSYVCKYSSYDNGKYTHAYNYGTELSDWGIEYNGTDVSGIYLFYGNGETCKAYNSTKNTTIHLTCDLYATEGITVTSAEYSDDSHCSLIMYARSSAACPATTEGSHHRRYRRHHGVAGFFVFIFTCCLMTLCCCACCRRRKCRQQKKEYQLLPQTTEMQTKIEPAPVQMMPQFIPVQQFGQPQQFYYPQFVPQYYPVSPMPMAPPQPMAVDPAQIRNDQIQSDEELARQLQAKYDQGQQ